MSIIGFDEDLPVAVKHDVYPFIDPSAHYTAQTFAGKVVLVTGASRGIGLETAVQFAKAGAHLVLVARKQATLDESKQALLDAKPDAQVLTFAADVTDSGRAQAAIQAAIERFSRLDVVVANAGAIRAGSSEAGFVDGNPNEWWKVLEVNVRGVYNYLHYAIPELKKTRGTFLVTTSRLAHIRLPNNSDYGLSKHAVNRLLEFAVLENPQVKAFSVHPGVVATELYNSDDIHIPAEDSVSLSAAVYLHLAAGKADYLNGRYLSSNWDLEEVEKIWKDKIVAANGLVSKLSIPA